MVSREAIFLKRCLPARRCRLYLEQDGICFYCQRPMSFYKPARDPFGRRVTVDHLTPRSKGGRYGYDNEVAACHRCNNRRGTMCWREFKQIIDAELQPEEA